MARPKKTSAGAKLVPIYLSSDEQYVIDTIQRRREKRGDARTGRSAIVVDALVFLLEHQEGVKLKQLVPLLDVEAAKTTDKIKPFPKPGR